MTAQEYLDKKKKEKKEREEKREDRFVDILSILFILLEVIYIIIFDVTFTDGLLIGSSTSALVCFSIFKRALEPLKKALKELNETEIN